MKQKRLIGHTTPRRTLEVERSDIRHYAAAVGCTAALHYDEEAAKKAGFSGVVAPASFVATLGDHMALTELLEVHPKNILHSEQTIELRRPIVAGDSIKVSSTITEIYERPIGSTTTGFVTIEDQGIDLKGNRLFYSKRVLAVRGGFPRR